MMTGTPHFVDDKSSDYLKFAKEFSTSITVPWDNRYYDYPEELAEKYKNNKNMIVQVKFPYTSLVDDPAKYEEIMRKALQDNDVYNSEVLMKWD
jgi:hypothetical protein